MMAIFKKNTTALFLAALVILASLLSSCDADQDCVVRTLLNCIFSRCSQVCGYKPGAHCTDISKCCCPVGSPSK
ncbi:hypothetical protein DAI22_09g005100 [Oryza sativa Japonica Group]|nr:hypothetical protein DAI22_09g005100 [Oryza sativa Japonica Group]